MRDYGFPEKRAASVAAEVPCFSFWNDAIDKCKLAFLKQKQEWIDGFPSKKEILKLLEYPTLDIKGYENWCVDGKEELATAIYERFGKGE